MSLVSTGWKKKKKEDICLQLHYNHSGAICSTVLMAGFEKAEGQLRGSRRPSHYSVSLRKELPRNTSVQLKDKKVTINDHWGGGQETQTLSHI